MLTKKLTTVSKTSTASKVMLGKEITKMMGFNQGSYIDLVYEQGKIYLGSNLGFVNKLTNNYLLKQVKVGQDKNVIVCIPAEISQIDSKFGIGNQVEIYPVDSHTLCLQPVD